MLKKVIAAVLIIVLVVAAGYFYVGYRSQVAAAGPLQTQIKNETLQATTITNKNQALQTEINNILSQTKKIEADIANTYQQVPIKTNSHEIIESVLVLGSLKEVTVIPLTSKEWTAVKIGQHNYQVFKMSFELVGQEDRLMPFLQDLQNLKYQPLVIESISLDKPGPEPPTTPAPTPANPTPTAPSNTLTVFTHQATDITEEKVTLNGNLFAFGAYTNVEVQFEYGTTLSYGTKTAAQPKLATGLFRDSLQWLIPATTYHYRAIATGSSPSLQPWTQNGNDMIFTTLTPPRLLPPDMLSLKVALAVYAR